MRRHQRLQGTYGPRLHGPGQGERLRQVSTFPLEGECIYFLHSCVPCGEPKMRASRATSGSESCQAGLACMGVFSTPLSPG